jgi:phosphoribosyl-AMP cyclohydrolase
MTAPGGYGISRITSAVQTNTVRRPMTAYMSDRAAQMTNRTDKGLVQSRQTLDEITVKTIADMNLTPS